MSANAETLLEAFNLFYQQGAQHYKRTWGDGSRSHFQSMARQWLPALKRHESNAALLPLLNNPAPLFSACPAPPELAQFLGHLNSEGTTTIALDEADAALGNLVLRILRDFSTPLTAPRPTSEIKMHIDTLRELKTLHGIQRDEELVQAYDQLMRSGHHTQFPPKFAEIAWEARQQAARSDAAQGHAQWLVSAYDRIASHLPRFKERVAFADFMEAWSQQLNTAFSAHPHFTTPQAKSDLDRYLTQALTQHWSASQVPSAQDFCIFVLIQHHALPSPSKLLEAISQQRTQHLPDIAKTVAQRFGFQRIQRMQMNDFVVKEFERVYHACVLEAVQNQQANSLDPVPSKSPIETQTSAPASDAVRARLKNLIGRN